MATADRERLQRLGQGERIAEVCQAAGMERGEFDDWWRQQLASRAPSDASAAVEGLAHEVEIIRDEWGIPHIIAESEDDLFFGFGYAIAEDRLFQLDYLRRRGLGRWAEVVGVEGLADDRIARTVGLNRIAVAEWNRLDAHTQRVLEMFSSGINAFMTGAGDRLPIEFDLLAYRPQPWSPVDCLAIESEFRWYLTGRFPIIVIPEMIKQRFGDGPLYREAILGEDDEESILLPGEYTAERGAELEPVGSTLSDPEGHQGSNNWVISGRRTVGGGPLIANDPHIAFEAVSCWYEVHLDGGDTNVAGMAYAGIPAVMSGRNEDVAWGLTNNICSQRDLYREKADSPELKRFRFAGEWEPARRIKETIAVRDGSAEELDVVSSRNGPVVNSILPPSAPVESPVTLKWLGAHEGGWLTGMLNMQKAKSVAEFREAVKPWHVPTFNMVVADVKGSIALQSTGRVPIRQTAERGYRDGADPEQQWQGLLPFEAMPHLVDPERGWIATANNRLARDDFPYPLSGCWASGWRARRIRQLIESAPELSMDDMTRMQLDTRSGRAEVGVPRLLQVLERESSPGDGVSKKQFAAAVDHLRDWDYRVEPEAVGATIFNAFFDDWCRAVAGVHFDEQAAELVAAGIQGCALRLLNQDSASWFDGASRERLIGAVFASALRRLSEELGAKVADWKWGNWHRLPLRHWLSSRGDLGELLNHGGGGIAGDGTTVCNTGYTRSGRANAGGGYRMAVDLATSPPTLCAVDGQSQSGNPASVHYRDQFAAWREGQLHTIHLDRKQTRAAAVTRQVLSPVAGT